MEDKSTKVITGKVRFGYANVWDPRSINGGEEKYSVCLIIPKSEKATLKKINSAIEEVVKTGAAKFGDTFSSGIKLPLHDGDTERADDEVYTGCYFINAMSTVKPDIVDKDLQPITDSSNFYSGCYGRASIVFYPYNINENKGVACALHNLQKLSDGEHIDGRSSPEEDFASSENDILS